MDRVNNTFTQSYQSTQAAKKPHQDQNTHNGVLNQKVAKVKICTFWGKIVKICTFWGKIVKICTFREKISKILPF